MAIILILMIFPTIGFNIEALPPSKQIDNSGTDMESVDPIVIEGNTGLENHELVTGSGTYSDPYKIANITIDVRNSDRGAIAIRNTTEHLLIQNIKIFASSSAPGIYLKGLFDGQYHRMNVVMDNITVVGGMRQLYLDYTEAVKLRNSNFSNPSGSGYNTYVIRSTTISFKNNSYNAPWQWIYFYRTPNVRFEQNSGVIYGLNSNYFRYYEVWNNTFHTRRWYVYSGWSSTFHGNNLTSDSDIYNLLTVTDCNNLLFDNNTFSGGKNTILVQHPNDYSPIYDYYSPGNTLVFENNVLKEGEIGIYFYYSSGDAYIRYIEVFSNLFHNFSSKAIRVHGGGSPTTHVWHNWFVENNGAGGMYKASNAQAEDFYGQFKWSLNGMGNYWSDKRVPDENSDGYIDESYSLISQYDGEDSHPVSNPYFDFEKPNIEITYPKGRFVPHKYVNFTWIGHDDLSGYRMTRMRKRGQGWVNITGRFFHSVILNKGRNIFEIQAWDRANLTRSLEIELSLNESVSPIQILYPNRNEFVNSSDITVEWNILNGFVPFNMTISRDDGPEIEVDPYGSKLINIGQGPHIIIIRSWDVLGTLVEKSVDFTVDTMRPSLEVIYPSVGSVISNHQVNFRWEDQDSTGIAWRRVKIDQGGWKDVSTSSYSELLGSGPHTFTVKVADRTGWTQERSTSFVISENTSLRITGPPLSGPTNRLDHKLSWEYLAQFEIDKLEITVDKDLPIEINTDLRFYNISFDDEGEHKVRVTGTDPVGNTISDSAYILVDLTPPEPIPSGLKDGDLLNASIIDLEWSVLEEHGVESYGIASDGNVITEDLEKPSYTLNLDEGFHNITLIARDLAGNTGSYTFMVKVDTIPPELEITEPSDIIVTSGYVDLRWKSSDGSGISHHEYSLNGGEFSEIYGSSSVSIQMEEGDHSFVLLCYDNAGNFRRARKRLTVDLKDPYISFENEDNFYGRDRSITLVWDAHDSMGIKNLTLSIDSNRYRINVDTRSFDIELDEGVHTVTIEAIDIADHKTSDSLTFTIDLTPPEVTKKEAEIDEDLVVIRWDPPDEKDLDYRLFIDGERSMISVDPEKGKLILRELSPGQHNVELRLSDMAGNNRTLTWDFTIEDRSESDSDNRSMSWIVILIAILALAFIPVLIFIIKRRTKTAEKEKKAEIPKRPEKLNMGGGNISLPVPNRQRESPPGTPKQGGTQAERKESDYIRPQKRSGQKRGPGSSLRETGRVRSVRPEVSRHEREKIDKEETGDIESWDDQEVLEDWTEMEEFEYVD